MNVHQNARLTPLRRRELVRRLEHEPGVRVAHELGVSLRTARKWRARFRTYGDAGLADRSSRPRSHPRQIQPAIALDAGRHEDGVRLQRRRKEKMSLVDMFLGGILCGVVLAAAVTFAIAIPANNTHWQVEIVKRGGGDWYFDKNGKITWMWTVKPNGVPVHAARSPSRQ